jgi:hypothetical protein
MDKRGNNNVQKTPNNGTGGTPDILYCTARFMCLPDLRSIPHPFEFSNQAASSQPKKI